MKIAVDVLKDSIRKTASIVKDKAVQPTDDKIIFDKDAIYAINDSQFVLIPMKCGFSAIVNGNEFSAYCQKISGGEVDVEVKEGMLSIVQGRSSARFELFECGVERPSIPKFGKLPPRFYENVSLASEGCGNDFSDVRTVVIHCAPSFIEASDGQRIIRCLLEQKLDADFLMPRNFMPVLSFFEIENYAESNGWMLFSDGDAVIGFRELANEDSYLDLGGIIEECVDGEELKFPEGLYDAVDKAAVFLSKAKFEHEKRISIKCKGGRMRVESHGGTGAYREVLSFEGEKNFDFSVNPKFLLDMLEKSAVIKVAEKYMRIETDNYIYLTSLAEA